MRFILQGLGPTGPSPTSTVDQSIQQHPRRIHNVHQAITDSGDSTNAPPHHSNATSRGKPISTETSHKIESMTTNSPTKEGESLHQQLDQGKQCPFEWTTGIRSIPAFSLCSV